MRAVDRKYYLLMRAETHDGIYKIQSTRPLSHHHLSLTDAMLLRLRSDSLILCSDGQVSQVLGENPRSGLNLGCKT